MGVGFTVLPGLAVGTGGSPNDTVPSSLPSHFPQRGPNSLLWPPALLPPSLVSSQLLFASLPSAVATLPACWGGVSQVRPQLATPQIVLPRRGPHSDAALLCPLVCLFLAQGLLKGHFCVWTLALLSLLGGQHLKVGSFPPPPMQHRVSSPRAVPAP